jgi:hypothetical protein
MAFPVPNPNQAITSITSGDGITVSGTSEVQITNAGVRSLSVLEGIETTGTVILLGENGVNIEETVGGFVFSASGGGGVSTVNGLTGAVSLVSGQADALAIATNENNEVVFYPSLDAALANRLQITTAAGINNTIVNFNDVQKPSIWIPDAATQSPTDGGPGWRSFKQVGITGAATQVQWYPYNPYYGESLPYTVNPAFPIPKKDLSALWAVIKTTNKISTQGLFFFNIYQYDIANPPVGTYNKRTDYAMYQYVSKWGGPTTAAGVGSLNAGYRYLICAVDTPKDSPQTTATVNATALVAGTRYTILTVGTANWTAVGAPVAAIGCVFTATGVAIGTGTATYEINTSLLIGNGVSPTQTTFLREPYNIHTSMPHITLNTVSNLTPGPIVGNPEDIPISAIVFGTTSSAVSPTLDFSVEYLGYSTTQGGSYQYQMVVE